MNKKFKYYIISAARLVFSSFIIIAALPVFLIFSIVVINGGFYSLSERAQFSLILPWNGYFCSIENVSKVQEGWRQVTCHNGNEFYIGAKETCSSDSLIPMDNYYVDETAPVD